MDKAYVDTVRLLLECAPIVFREPQFAMKGGTALNLFLRNMPRLSVDIDVVYSDYRPTRQEALKEIASGLASIEEALGHRGLETKRARRPEGDEVKLLVRRARAQVKMEVNFVFRGTLLPIEIRPLTEAARQLFTTKISVPVLAEAELYGSKIVAALDRQHPRDLFDIQGLYENGGMTPEIIECFVCYLAGHNRPIHEVLFSHDRDLAPLWNNEFQGMTNQGISLDELQAIRRRLRQDLFHALTAKQRQFLIGLALAEPDWDLMTCPHLADMPAIRWKLQNLEKLRQNNPAKFQSQAKELKKHWDRVSSSRS